MALSSTEDEPFVHKMLAMILDGTLSRSDLRIALFYYVRNPNLRRQAWSWIKKNFEIVRNYFPLWFLRIASDGVPICGVEDELQYGRRAFESFT
jgi:hypothetical protein